MARPGPRTLVILVVGLVSGVPAQNGTLPVLPEEDCGMGTAGGFWLGLFLGMLGAVGGLYLRKRMRADVRRNEMAMSHSMVHVSASSGPPGVAGSSSLPDGWTEATDPATNRTYYYQAGTGRTSWTLP